MCVWMALLAALVTVFYLVSSVKGDKRCNGFRHLENGQTFFRYGGLKVTFRCNPGYQLHGYRTNSCVSGRWSRDTPVCVGSGCPNPGPLAHGTSNMNKDGSWAVFSCDSGFQLHGSAVLYCKGLSWNTTKPVCKESDMMSSVSAAALHSQQHPHYNSVAITSPKEAPLKSDLSHTSSQMSDSAKIKVTNPKVQLQQQIWFSKLQVNDGDQKEVNEARRPETETGGEVTEGRAPGKEAKEEFASKSHQSTTVSSTLSLASGTDSPITAVSKQTHPTMMSATTLRPHTESALQHRGVPPSEATPSSSDTSSQFQPSLRRPGSADDDQPIDTPTHTSTTPAVSTTSASSAPPVSTSLPSFSASPSLRPSSAQAPPTPRPDVILPSNTTTEPRSQLTEHHNQTLDGASGPPPWPSVCPYPPVPAHGTVYFHNVENPGPRESRHFIQYACDLGYTLAHGDRHSFCQQGGTWSGITPVCLELSCSVNNGGCSQLCFLTQHSNQNQTRTQCRCRPGFVLLGDGRTCRDVNECVERLHPCQQRCINTFGSFKCSCEDGYQPDPAQSSCTDVDECLLPAAVTGCVFGCVNTPGSFYCECPAGYSLQSAESDCQDIDECAVNEGLGPCAEKCHNLPGSYRCSCRYGHILAGDGHNCIAECPPGYRKQQTTPENSTSQALKEECVDVNECLEGGCEWQCVNLPGSHRCMCPRGYTLQKDGRSCKDIDECHRRNGGCSHLCVNHKGGHKCACPASHRLATYSWKKCLPKTMMS